MSKIYVRNLTKTYGGLKALNNVSLDIESGEFLVLLGPSGCGKTTLLRCLAGLETPDEGEIIMGEKIVFSAALNIMVPPGKRNLGMVFQSYALWPHMTVRDNVKFGLDVLKTPTPVANTRLDDVLGDVGLGALGERYPSELSGGQQQRVALARLLATQPPIFLMDEPLSNLDARLRMDMRVELKRFQSNAKATTVYVTHDQTEAMTMSTRVVVMKDGEIQQISPPDQLYRQPENTFVADFVGMPRINLIELTAENNLSPCYSNGDLSLDIGWVPGCSRITVGARPEDISIIDKTVSGEENFKISAVLPNGPETIVQLTRGKTTLITRVSHDSKFVEGQTVDLSFNVNALNIYATKTGSLIMRDPVEDLKAC